jgi:uncharacterized protein
MHIAVVSDTHGNLANTMQAVRRLGEFEIAAVLHCGDIGSPSVVPLFAEWPTHFVFGNVDGDEVSLRHAIREAGQSCHERFAELDLHGRKIALLHSDDARRFRQVTEADEYDLVCYGHSHVYEQHRSGRTLVLNPGALHRANPHTFAVVNLETMTAEHVPLDGSLSVES